MFGRLRARWNALSRASLRERVTLLSLARSVLLVGFGALVAGTLLVWLAPIRGPVRSVEPALGSLALRTAGAERLFVVASVGIGLGRLYLTAIPLLLLLVGFVAALAGRRWSVPAAILFGAAAAGTVTALSGCKCGSGATEFLAQRAVQALVNGTAPFVVG